MSKKELANMLVISRILRTPNWNNGKDLLGYLDLFYCPNIDKDDVRTIKSISSKASKTNGISSYFSSF